MVKYRTMQIEVLHLQCTSSARQKIKESVNFISFTLNALGADSISWNFEFNSTYAQCGLKPLHLKASHRIHQTLRKFPELDIRPCV